MPILYYWFCSLLLRDRWQPSLSSCAGAVVLVKALVVLAIEGMLILVRPLLLSCTGVMALSS